MYKGTRHSRGVWSYKASSACSASISSAEASVEAVQKSCHTLVGLRLLRSEDFGVLMRKMATNGPRVVKARIGRAQDELRLIGVPESLIFSAPGYLLVAPKLRTVLSRLRRLETDHTPAELKELQGHLKNHGGQLDVTASRTGPDFARSTVYRIAKNGAKVKLPRNAPDRKSRERQISGRPQSASGSGAQTAMAQALKKAIAAKPGGGR